MIDKMTSIFCRLFFAVASLLFIVAGVSWVIGLFGWKFLWLPYQPGRLFELAAIMVIFIVALMLRQIREALRKP